MAQGGEPVSERVQDETRDAARDWARDAGRDGARDEARDEQVEVYRTLDLALRVGEVVLSSGAGTTDATATILAVTAAGGLRGCEVDITFTSIAISY